jgi:flavin-dependent dehydrogenase
MATSYDFQCDVLIIGGGLTGGLLARQMKLEMPDLDIIVVEGKTEFDYWIGESTVEAFDIYCDWACKLGQYLDKWYANKQGLRYFFDTPDKTLEVAEMSEFGRRHANHFRASQLDRIRIDTDLVQFNRDVGVRVLLGTRVLGGRKPDELAQHIKIDPKHGHTVETSAGVIHCKWVVDAGGRSAPLARMLNQLVIDERMPVSTYWGRFKGINIIDHLGDDEWRARVNNIYRWGSTCHFMYKGHWFWLIPVSHDILSIGVCWDRAKAPYDLKIKDGEQLEQFFRTYRCADQVLGKKAERLDFLAFSYSAQYSKQRFSRDRWYITGMASCCIDALNSNTSRQFPENNTYVVKCIKADREGNTKKLDAYIKHFNIRMQQVYEGAVTAYSNYEYFGSFDVIVPFFMGNIATYWNSLVPDFLNRFQGIQQMAEAHGTDCNCTVENSQMGFVSNTLGAYRRLTQEMYEYVERTGNYHSNNKGVYQPQDEIEIRPGLTSKMFKRPRDLKAEAEEDRISYEIVFKHQAKRMAELEGRTFDEVAFKNTFVPDLQARQTLTDVVTRCSKKHI